MHDVMCIDPVFCTNYEKNHTQRIVATTPVSYTHLDVYKRQGVYYKQNDVGIGSLSRSLRGDLLDAEAITRPALEALLTQNGIDPAPYLQTSRVRACINQYGLLTGCKGSLTYKQRRDVFARILADADARAALRARLQNDPNRLLALPYKLGLALRAPGLLAAYTLAKQRFL